MKDKILTILQTNSYITAGEIAEYLNASEKEVERNLSHLLTSGKVKQFNRQYRIAYEGKVAKARKTPMIGVYDGKELRPYVGRPGAMDAFSMPSLVAGVRVSRTLPTGMLAKKHPAEAR